MASSAPETTSTSMTFSPFPLFLEQSENSEQLQHLQVCPNVSFGALSEQLSSVEKDYFYICTEIEYQEVHAMFHNQTLQTDNPLSTFQGKSKYHAKAKSIGTFIAPSTNYLNDKRAIKENKLFGLSVIADILMFRIGQKETAKRFQKSTKSHSKLINQLKEASLCECGMMKEPFDSSLAGNNLTVAQIEALLTNQPDIQSSKSS
ncbi:hypothetical protein D5R81_16815 [Parashewanella spongiae]|uniref:Uncharacterized protein n=1 Tax=Parashewanella spongiae TaxID=342950 RepID=A0A3A6TQJ6_9GAMM|nr:hypothetical protein [Parashewanella spongiae]MCL1079715.1 hypothetical protein [Parashewanella spongiae]RJY07023.1 hypothetical protein D5R81_16815 [Parashewanella spongiae]